MTSRKIITIRYGVIWLFGMGIILESGCKASLFLLDLFIRYLQYCTWPKLFSVMEHNVSNYVSSKMYNFYLLL